MAIGTEIEAHKFPYPFYFSRVLDVDLAKMQLADQRSIRFEIYKGQTVLEITGNYYAAYSADRMDSYARLKETFETVVMPMLQAEVPHFPDDSEFSAFAIEVSHHVRQKVMGVTSEQPENVTVIIPVLVAQKLVDAKTDDQKQAAILEAKVFLNGQPYSLWLQEGAPSEEWKEKFTPLPATKKQPVETASYRANPAASTSPSVSANLMKTFADADADLHAGVSGGPSTSERGRHRRGWSRTSTGRRTSLPTRRRPSSDFARVPTCSFPYALRSKPRRKFSLQACGTGLRRAHVSSHTAAAELLSARS